MVVVGGVVAAGTVANAAAAELPTVTLTIDGTATTVSTTATTVDQVLGDHAVATDSNDEVTPALWTQVSDGMQIDVVTRVAVRVKHQDVVETHLVAANTVADLKNELSLPTRSATTQRIASVDSADAVAWTRTVVDTPSGRRLTLGDELVEGSIATVQRVRVVTDSRRETVKPATVKKKTPLLYSGTTKVLRDGRTGRRHVVLRTFRVDGAVVGRKVLEQKVLRDDRKRVVALGTGPNWEALARCESGNNPNAVNPAGFYGLYQFSVSTWQSVGGTGNPVDASRWEQTKRAWILYRGSGSGPWPVCGAYL
jgi:hypothetical protein